MTMKLLISGASGIGDLIMLTPALRRLKELRPDYEISLFVDHNNKDIVTGLPYITNIFTRKRGKLLSRYHFLPELLRQDFFIFLDWQPHVVYLLYLLGKRNIFGTANPNFFRRIVFRKLTRKPRHSSDYLASTIAEIISEILDIKIDGDMTKTDISQPNEQVKQQANDLLSGIGRFVCLAPFGSKDERNWPVEYCNRLIRLLPYPVVTIGPASKKHLPISGHNIIGKTSLMEMVEIIKRANILVGTDSGPVHVAGALGVPCVAMYTKDLPSRWAPRHKCQVIYHSLPCSPCEDKRAEVCQGRPCLYKITPELVIEKLMVFDHK